MDAQRSPAQAPQAHLPLHMQAVRIDAPRSATLARLPLPRPAATEVLIAIRRAGICGTDLHIWHGDYALSRFPLVPGHEFSGRVAAVGEAVARIAPGDRVTADPNLPCGRCRECQRGAFNQCHALAAVGVTRAGAFAEYVLVPEAAVHGLGRLSFEEGALVEPLACVVWGLRRVAPQLGDRVLLFGAGPMGCLLLQALLRSGATEVTVVDRSEARLALAGRLGATRTLRAHEVPEAAQDAAPHGFDVVVEATGDPRVLERCFAHARARGKVLVFGVAPQRASAAFAPFEVFRKDLTIVGSFALNQTFGEAIALLEAGAVATAPLVSHRFALADHARAFAVAEHDPERMKVQLVVADDAP
jgi:D-arabinitol dehydrogenase (NADP+)